MHAEDQTSRRDEERVRRNCAAIRGAGVGGVVCALPENVLLLSGYWPVTGTAVAVATAEGAVGLVVPEDERELAERSSWADEVRTFEPGSLDRLYAIRDVVGGPLGEVLGALGVSGTVGYEAGDEFMPASYASVHVYGGALLELLRRSGFDRCVPVGGALARARSVCTRREVALIRRACEAVGGAFGEGAGMLKVGAVEAEAGARVAGKLLEGRGDGRPDRSGGHVAVMSGARAGKAYGSYALSSGKVLAAGELVMVHCNSVRDGFWTDVTRTFCLGGPSGRQGEMYEAVSEARAAALAAIRPGVTGADVDRAARAVMEARGFGDQFKHPTGHGVGYVAIDHNALPRLHPKSGDVLEEGMVFNVEPAVYFEGEEGMRHCDVVACTADGAEVLTPFLAGRAELVVPA